jgi:hypothetical protein
MIIVFGEMTPCKLVDRYQSLGGHCNRNIFTQGAAFWELFDPMYLITFLG